MVKSQKIAKTNTKNGKTENDFRFIVFPFMYEKTQKRKNKNRVPFYLCSFFVRTNTKNGKTTNDFLFYRFSFYVLKHTKTTASSSEWTI